MKRTKEILALIAMVVASTSVHAEVIGIDNITLDSSPPSTIEGDGFQLSGMHYFPEAQSAPIVYESLVVNEGSNIPVGTLVNSYFVYLDPVDEETVTGSITFDVDVLGVISGNVLLRASNYLGAPGLTYNICSACEFDYEDSHSISGDLRTVTLTATADSPGDFARIITESDLELIAIGISGPNEIGENSKASYKAIAYYEGGITADFTSLVEWSIEPNTHASMSEDGVLTTEEIHMLQPEVTIYAQYTQDDNALNAEKTVSIYAICPTGSALEFDGTDDYVEAPTSVIIPNSESKSISMWFKVNSWERWTRLFMWWDGTNRVVMTLGSNQGQLGATMNNNADGGLSTIGSGILVGKWHHACVTFDGSTTLIYLDGQEQSVFAEGAWYVNDEGVFIGARKGSDQYFDGIIDEVQIWDRALTAEEIQTNMHKKLIGDEPNLVACWNFDEGEGQSANDASGHGNVAQLGASPDTDDSDPGWIDSDAPVGSCAVVPDGYTVEAYVTGLRNPTAIAFSPGGDFGYEGQLCVGDSCPDSGTIYRVPSMNNMAFFTVGAGNLPRGANPAIGPMGPPGRPVTCAIRVPSSAVSVSAASLWASRGVSVLLRQLGRTLDPLL